MPKGDGTAADLANKHYLADHLMQMKVKFIMQDVAVLNGIKFGPGFLIAEDKYYV